MWFVFKLGKYIVYMCKYLDCPFMVSHADTGAACLCVVYLYWVLCLCLCVLSFCEVCICVCVVTLIARSWSLMLTLVLRCQQTCMVVLARCWTFLSWDTPFTSPSTPTLSDEPVTDKNIKVKTCDRQKHKRQNLCGQKQSLHSRF